jgi:dienelactone hydrolase
VTCTTTTIPAGAVALPVERCEPAAGAAPAGPRPAVLVLNGCGGYEADAGITSLLTRRLAERGVVALRLDYLAADPKPAGWFCDRVHVLQGISPILAGAAAAVAAVRADPTVDPARVGAMGYSLGGLVTGLVQVGGGELGPVPAAGFAGIGLLSPAVAPLVVESAGQGKLPPTLVAVGDRDEVVGSARAVALRDAAAAAGAPVELVLVPGQGHEWRGAPAEDMAARFADFLSQQLAAVQPGERA